MSAPQFTPGPWYVCEPFAGFSSIKQAETDALIFGIAAGDPDEKQSDDVCEANANLIAAAPDLYSDAEFLCARIRELEGEMTDDDELSRQYFGHVLPAVARMESCLKEALGNGSGQ